jgi:uncharacterized protein
MDFVLNCRYDNVEQVHSQLETTKDKQSLILTPHNNLNGLFAVCGNGHAHLLHTFSQYLTTDDLNSQNEQGNTPLHWASLNGHVEVVKMLLELGVNPLIRNHSGLSPATVAEQANHVDIVTLLLESYDPLDGDDGDSDEETTDR